MSYSGFQSTCVSSHLWSQKKRVARRSFSLVVALPMVAATTPLRKVNITFWGVGGKKPNLFFSKKTYVKKSKAV